MTIAYVKLCNKARCPVDFAGLSPDGALLLWKRLAIFKARRGYTLDLVRQIVEAQREEERQPVKDITSPENKRRLDTLAKKIGRRM